MKKIIISLALTLLTIAGAVAQVPQGFNYQAVVRNAQGELVTDATVGVRISLLQGSADGRTVYIETQTPQTNAGGLFTIVIGQGDATTGSFATIDWANGPYFINSEVDPEGGNNYTVSSVQQLLSVPYAMYAGSAANAGDVTRAYVDSAVAAIEVPAAGVTQGYVDSAIAAISLTGGANVVYDGVRDTVVCGDYEDGWYGTESYFDLYVEAGIMHFYQMNYTVVQPEYHDTTIRTDSSSYVWHGDTYTTSGSYYWYGNTATECIVEHITLILNASSQSEVIVTFGDNVYNPGYASAEYYPEESIIVLQTASRREGSALYFPCFFGYLNTTTTGTYPVPDDWVPQYYQNTLHYDDNGDYYADWQYYGNGTYTITAIDFTAGTISGTYSATMYYLTDLVENGVESEDEATHRQLTVQFTNMPLTTHGNTTDTTTTNPDADVTVSFNGNTWEPQFAVGYYQDGTDAFFQINVASDPDFSSYPMAFAYTEGIGTGLHMVSNAQYYQDGYFQTSDVEGNIIEIGDWISFANGNANITMFDTLNNLASGSLTVTLYSLNDYVENLNNGNDVELDQCLSSLLTITFNNLPLIRIDIEDTTSTIDTTNVNPNPGVDTLSNVIITFGDTVYTPGYASAYYYPDYSIIELSTASRMDNIYSALFFPVFFGYLNANTGSYTVENTMLQGSVLAPEYYERTFYENQSTGYQYGDWQYYNNGTYTITSVDFTAGTISGTYSATMYSLTDIVNDTTLTPDSATHRQLSVEFTNIPMTTYGNSSSVAPTARPASMYRSDIAMPRTVTPRRANLNF